MARTNDDFRDTLHWEAVEDATELLQEKRFEEALVALREVLKADPNNGYAYNYVGTAFEELGKLDAARDAYQAAVRVAPDYLGARVGLSHALRLLGDARGALVQANEALRRFPKDADAMHAVALAHAARGERKKATEHLATVLDLKPTLEAQQEVRELLEMLGLGPEGEPIDFE